MGIGSLAMIERALLLYEHTEDELDELRATLWADLRVKLLAVMDPAETPLSQMFTLERPDGKFSRVFAMQTADVVLEAAKNLAAGVRDSWSA